MNPVAAAAVAALADAGEVLPVWARLSSGSHDLPGLERMRALVAARAAGLGAEISVVPVGDDGRAVLRLVRRPDAPRRVLLVGHLDTVHSPAAPGPSVALNADGVLTGPGVADMKGGLLVMLAALRGLEASPHADRLGWEVLVTPDEELGSPVSLPVLTEAAGRADLGLAFEPASEGAVVVGRRGRVVVRVSVAGRAAHAGRDPSQGRNAITALAEIVLCAEALADPDAGCDVTVGLIRGGSVVNAVPDAAHADLDVRVPDDTTRARVLGGLGSACAAVAAHREVEAQVTELIGCPAMPVTPAAEALAVRYVAAAAEVGFAVQAVTGGGVSDANHLAGAGLTVLDGLGVVGGGLHGPEEWASLPSLPERAAAAALLLEGLATRRVP